MKCILHIGTEKTGTTSIQTFLVQNGAALSARGVALSRALWPGNNRALPLYFQDSYDDMDRRLRLKTRAERQRYLQPALDAFREEVEAARPNHATFLISSEHLHSRLTRREELVALHGFLAGMFDEIEVHAYFREQSSLVKSNYSTWVEGGGGAASLSEFSRQAVPGNVYYDYFALSEMWSDVFGKSAFHARIYNRAALHDGDVRKDLLHNIVGLESHSGLTFPAVESNRSLGALGVVFARALNTALPQFWFGGRRNRLRDAVMRVFVRSGAAYLGRSNFAEAGEVRERFRASNERFSARYLESPTDPFPTVGPA